jgi:hypothetical protein
VPDLLIYYLNLNQVHLRDRLPPLAMHWFVRQQLVFARRQGLRAHATCSTICAWR